MKSFSIVGIVIYGVVTFVLLPFLLVSINSQLNLPEYKSPFLKLIGSMCMVFGSILGLYSARVFAINGKGGSPLPLDPPKQLITTDIYRWIRNPMFVVSDLVWFGEFLFDGSILLFFYTLAWTTFNHIHLVIQDEKWLEKRYGDEYKRYKQKVPRYFPRIKLFTK